MRQQIKSKHKMMKMAFLSLHKCKKKKTKYWPLGIKCLKLFLFIAYILYFLLNMSASALGS